MSKASSSKGKPEVIGVEFRPAQGGIVSETHTRTKRGGQGGGPMEDHDHETAVHPTIEDAHEHLTKMLGHCYEGADRETKADEE